MWWCDDGGDGGDADDADGGDDDGGDDDGGGDDGGDDGDEFRCWTVSAAAGAGGSGMETWSTSVNPDMERKNDRASARQLTNEPSTPHLGSTRARQRARVNNLNTATSSVANRVTSSIMTSLLNNPSPSAAPPPYRNSPRRDEPLAVGIRLTHPLRINPRTAAHIRWWAYSLRDVGDNVSGRRAARASAIATSPVALAARRAMKVLDNMLKPA